MLSTELLLVLAAGTVVMCALIAWQLRWYRIAGWKSLVIAVALVLTGVFGSQLWFFVENLSFGGRSFFGAIFFAPLIFWPIAKLLRIPYTQALDCCPPAGCLMLALVKIQCLRDGCCGGMVLYINDAHEYVCFPSQIVEMVDFLLIGTVLFLAARRKTNRGRIFPFFLVLYGATRFILNLFRDVWGEVVWLLPVGNYWALLAVIAGAVWLFLSVRREAASTRTDADETAVL